MGQVVRRGRVDPADVKVCGWSVAMSVAGCGMARCKTSESMLVQR